jgi:uncharacterized protein YggE
MTRRSIVRKSIVCFVVLCAALSARASSAVAQSGAAVTPPQIVTSGEGEARVTPDRATISIGVQSRAPTAAAAAADNARRQRAILDTLRALGLASEDLSTNNYNVSPEMQYTPNGAAPPKVIAYTVTNTVRAELRKMDDIGRVIDAALAKGANEISSLQFRSTKADSARRAALGLAVANAKADAEALARAAGGSVGSLLEVSTTSITPPRVYDMAVRTASAKVATPIEPGEQTISANVTVRWVFNPGR